MNATIFAVASGAGRAGIAVLRLSGPLSGGALATLSGHSLPKPRRATRVHLRSGAGDPLDDGLALWFPAPRSFTGEDVVELHLHGSRAVLAALSEALLGLGLRPAEPGEFSRRAFHNGKMDLTQAEGLADLIDAETEAQRRQALRQIGGELAALYDGWRADLVRAQAHLEAAIDFAEEGLPEDLIDQVHTEVRALRQRIRAHLDDNHRGERLRDGVRVTILGAPNVGKSSLLNRLARRDAAIVSAIAGTTRDVIEVHLDLGGFPVIIADTAGLRDTAEVIEEEGIRRALDRAGQADIVLAVFDGAYLPVWDETTLRLIDSRTLVVVNKVDAAPADLPEEREGRPVLAVSARTGEGLDRLMEVLGTKVEALFSEGGMALTRERYRAALMECTEALARSERTNLPDLAAEDIRLAARALGRITGRVDVEDLLDV
ncbi:MAG: tRNA uridine-5-carboxymethylaminomethyl(34) synthesis GTPase MnmE, partial [Rhodospirillales bacterium]|nr:tRNA uridine-5-carboxymethylaminomethyl(34) synthesis GTPase MnmE [Rhodospirillales bacterium]